MGKQHGTKKGTKICLFIFFALIIGAAVFFFSTAKDEKAADEYFSMSTNAERVGFLNEQGWIVKPDPLSREEITIPTEFNELYQKYAQLQSEQGFDLEKYAGKRAKRYTYEIINYPTGEAGVQANLLIYKNKY